ncbi:MAG TPA: MFS transporter [Dehalococcoidia bacterium]|nr:MFS transporter [Dehalococcoidia bacterium]
MVVLSGVFMAALDTAIVNVAAPHIRADLGVSGSALVLVVSGYTLAYAMLLITGARLGDSHGHRRLFGLGLAGFTLASLLCGLAPGGAVLIGARVTQGGAAALMVPQALAIIQLQFQGAERARALGLYATTLSAGAVAGQIAGGALVTANLFGSSWRPVFLVNVPVGIALLVAVRRCLDPTRGQAVRRTDLPGVALLSTAVLLVLLPLILGQSQGWPAWCFGAFAAGAAVTAVALAPLRRRGRRSGDPLVDLSVFREPGVGRGLASLFASFAAYGGFLFAFSFYLQAGLGESPLRSGLTYAPMATVFAVASLGHTRLPGRLQPWLAPAGLACLGAGYGALGLLNHSGRWQAGPSLVLLCLVGAGFGLGFSPVIGRTVARLGPRHAPDASGLINTTIQLGYVSGVAALGSYFLGNARPGDPVSAGHAFAGVSLALVLLAFVAALFAATLRGTASGALDLPMPTDAAPEAIVA